MTYTIPRYPVHLIDVVRLVDGSRITIRPTLPQDLELQREFFRSLSTEGRYRRFMGSLNELPEAMAQRFISIDYRSHSALLAEVFEDGREIMIGEARYVVDEYDPATCEFALAVAGDWQACGIGRALLVRLEREAEASGIRCSPILSTTTKRCAHLPPAAVTRSRQIVRMQGSSDWRSS